MLDEIRWGHYAGVGPHDRDNKVLKVLNWNIGRGIRVTGVMEVIDREQPDICIFQEVDLNTRRSGWRNLPDILAARFEFNYAFGVEYEELSQESENRRAFHGQAVLCRTQIGASRVLRFSGQSGFWYPRWYVPCLAMFQRRRGGRMALVTELALDHTALVIYNLHLESRGSGKLRLLQLSEVVRDSLRYPNDTPVVVAGDLNTGDAASPLRSCLLTAGFRDASGGGPRGGTTPTGRTLDWIFVRGPIACAETKVHRWTSASDHYPLSTILSLVDRPSPTS
ncbi:MAG TPA: endonuclease/exonuclease/phosphatase family protein [Bryobacteraceae bacterium]|nr:endonuclease/exonuclease/phosphatase family protein [Bryobacteraceae bacterium]